MVAYGRCPCERILTQVVTPRLLLSIKKSYGMRKIVLGVAVSLDGLIEGPNGEFDWCFTDQDYGMAAFLETVDAILYGRKSYELMLRWEGGNPFGQLKSYVFSNSWKGEQKDFELVSGDVISRVNELRRSPGKSIWLFGGADLTASLMNAGLVDELWLSVHPIVLGAGKPLFNGVRDRVTLQLVESRPYKTGLLSLRYSVVR
jgi:dihydrofolate reductase